MQGSTFDVKASSALMGTIVCWSLVPVLLREIAEKDYVDAWTANGFRYPLAAILYWPILIMAARARKLRRELLGRAIVPALFTFCGQILWALAPYYLQASLIGFFIQTALAWTVIGSMILFSDERKLLRSPAFYAGLLLAAGGFLVLSMSRGVLQEPETLTGVVIILATGFFFGGYAVAIRYFMKNESPILAFGVVAQYVSVGVLILMALFADFTSVPDVPLRGWSFLAVSAVMGIAVAHVLLYVAIQRIGATISHGVSLLVPFVTLLLAWFILGESLKGAEWAGGAAMVVGGGLLLLCQARVRS